MLARFDLRWLNNVSRAIVAPVTRSTTATSTNDNNNSRIPPLFAVLNTITPSMVFTFLLRLKRCYCNSLSHIYHIDKDSVKVTCIAAFAQSASDSQSLCPLAVESRGFAAQ